MIYLITFVITLIFSYLYAKKYTKGFAVAGSVASPSSKLRCNCFQDAKTGLSKIILFLLTVFPLWFITAFRYDTGTDYLFTYVKFFDAIRLGGTPYGEPLFQLLNKVLVSLNLSYVWLFAICGAIINVAVFKFIFDQSPYPILSIAIYCCSAIFFNTLNNVRQYLAIAIAVFSLFQDKNWKSVLIITVAGLFHFSAFLFLLFFLVSKLRLDRSSYTALSLTVIILTPLILVGALGIISQTHYRYLIGYSGGFSIFTVLINLLLYIFVLMYFDKDDSKFQVLANMQMIAIFFCACSILLQNEEFSMRLIRMATYFHILLIPQIVKKERVKSWRIFIGALFVLLYLAYTVYTVYMCGGLGVFPYKFIF